MAPPRDSSRSLFARIAELEASGAPAAVVTVVQASGSTPREPGARMIVHQGGKIEGTIGGGRVEQEAITAAQAAITSGATKYLELKLTQELGMCCGGQVALFIEPIERPPALIIFGAGHVGAALGKVAAESGFLVHLVDERTELIAKERLPWAHGSSDDLDDPRIPWSPQAFVMITTHDHALDQRLVERALKKPRQWLGVIGSRRKAELTRQRLEQKGFTPEEIAAVRCPVGVAIAAETPAEIAVSILAELIAVRRGAGLEASEGGLAARLEAKQPRRTRRDREEDR